MGKKYPSDLTDEEWEIIEPFIPEPKTGGRPVKYERREIFNAILYIIRSGCSWRMLPNDFPYWESVYYYFSEWKKDGTFKRIMDLLREELREGMGRNKEPSAGIIDSQSVKITDKGGLMVMMLSRK